MGTTFNVKVVDTDKKLDARAIDASIKKSLHDINAVMSTYIEDSELSLINKNASDDWLSVSASLCEVLELAQGVSVQSAGAFDVTVGPLVNLWGFGPKTPTDEPSADEVTRVQQEIGFDKLKLDCDRSRIRKSGEIFIDLSAIAKGLATENVAIAIEELGAKDLMVEIGGELSVRGVNADAVPWKIAVEKPSLIQSGAVQVLSLKDVSIATSGDYRNFRDVNGKRISHTIDPVSGYSVDHNLASVTVIARSGAEADAWATAFSVLGPKKGFAIAREYGIAAYFITRENQGAEVSYTDAFKPYMVTQ